MKVYFLQEKIGKNIILEILDLIGSKDFFSAYEVFNFEIFYLL